MVKCEVVSGTAHHATMIKCLKHHVLNLTEVVIDRVSAPVILRLNMEVFPIEFSLQILYRSRAELVALLHNRSYCGVCRIPTQLRFYVAFLDVLRMFEFGFQISILLFKLRLFVL